jgi:hypothetical protein
MRWNGLRIDDTSLCGGLIPILIEAQGVAKVGEEGSGTLGGHIWECHNQLWSETAQKTITCPE